MKIILYFFFSVASLALPHVSSGTPNGADNAGNYLGQSTYIGINGGSGFTSGAYYPGAGNPNTGAFLGSSGQIDTIGLAFGLTSGTSGISRNFGPAGSVALLNVGQTFGLQLQAASGSYNLSLIKVGTFGTTVGFSGSAANADYILTLIDQTSPSNITTRTYDTGVPFNTTALTFGFTQNDGSFTFALTPKGGATATLTETSLGGFASGFNLNVGTTNSTLYFNNLTVVPEPKSAVLLAMGLSGGVGLWLKRVA